MERTRLHRAIAAGLLGLALTACELWDGLTRERAADGGVRAEGAAAAPGAEGAAPATGGAPRVARAEDEAGLTASDRQLRGAMEGVFRYTDAAGVVHYVDSEEKIPPRYRKRAVHPTGGAVTVLPSTPIDELLAKEKIDPASYARKPAAATRTHGQVLLYTTSWCPHCTRARDHLRQRGVSFTERDVERDRAALEEMLKKTGGSRGVPVIDVRGTILRGFSPQSVDRALGS